eukprot:PhM_4_TR10073/c0_g1_i2/m.46926
MDFSSDSSAPSTPRYIAETTTTNANTGPAAAAAAAATTADSNSVAPLDHDIFAGSGGSHAPAPPSSAGARQGSVTAVAGGSSALTSTPTVSRRVLGGEEFQKLFRDTISTKMTNAQNTSIRRYADPSSSSQQKSPERGHLHPTTTTNDVSVEPSRVNQIEKIYSKGGSAVRRKVTAAMAAATAGVVNKPAARTRPLRMTESDGYRLYDELVQCKESLRAMTERYTKTRAECQKLSERMSKSEHEKSDILRVRRSHDIGFSQLHNANHKIQVLQQKTESLEKVVASRDEVVQSVRNECRTAVVREMQIKLDMQTTELVRLRQQLESVQQSERVKRHRDEMAVAMSIVEAREREIEQLRRQLRGVHFADVTSQQSAQQIIAPTSVSIPEVNIVDVVSSTPAPAPSSGGSPMQAATPRPPTPTSVIAGFEPLGHSVRNTEREHALEQELERTRQQLLEARRQEDRVRSLEDERATLEKNLSEVEVQLQKQVVGGRQLVEDMRSELEKKHNAKVLEITRTHNDLTTHLNERVETTSRRVADLEAELRQEKSIHQQELDRQSNEHENKLQMLLETLKRKESGGGDGATRIGNASSDSVETINGKIEALSSELERVTQERDTLTADKTQLEQELSKYRRELLTPKPVTAYAAVQTDEASIGVLSLTQRPTDDVGLVMPVQGGGGATTTTAPTQAGLDMLAAPTRGRYKPETDTMSEITVKPHGHAALDDGNTVVHDDYNDDSFDV